MNKLLFQRLNRGRFLRSPTRYSMHQHSKMIITSTWSIGANLTTLLSVCPVVCIYGVLHLRKWQNYMIWDKMMKSHLWVGLDVACIYLSALTQEWFRFGMSLSKSWLEYSRAMKVESVPWLGTQACYLLDRKTDLFRIMIWEWKMMQFLVSQVINRKYVD